jgi:hypothetical protein
VCDLKKVVYCKFADHNGAPLADDLERLCGAGVDDSINVNAMAHVANAIDASQLHAVMAEEYDEGFEKYAARVAEEFTA